MKCVSLTATGLDQITGDGQVFVDVMLLLRCSITFFFFFLFEQEENAFW